MKLQRPWLISKRALLGVYAVSLGTLLTTLPQQASAQDTIAQRQARVERVNKLYSMAEKAYQDGDIDVARDTLKLVLVESPRHPHAIALLKKIRLNGSDMVLAKKKRQFEAVMLKEIDYKEINLAQALKVLNLQIMEASDKKVIPNFVLSDPKKVMGDERIDLQLNNVPAGVVLDHLLKKTGTSARFSKYSITITPRPSTVSRKSATKADPEPSAEPENE